MKKILGWILIVGGVVLGLYVGLYVLFIGGIIGIIEELKSKDIDSMVIALDVCKLIFATPIGGLVAMLFVMPGSLIKDIK